MWTAEDQVKPIPCSYCHPASRQLHSAPAVTSPRPFSSALLRQLCSNSIETTPRLRAEEKGSDWKGQWYVTRLNEAWLGHTNTIRPPETQSATLQKYTLKVPQPVWLLAGESSCMVGCTHLLEAARAEQPVLEFLPCFWGCCPGSAVHSSLRILLSQLFCGAPNLHPMGTGIAWDRKSCVSWEHPWGSGVHWQKQGRMLHEEGMRLYPAQLSSSRGSRDFTASSVVFVLTLLFTNSLGCIKKQFFFPKRCSWLS